MLIWIANILLVLAWILLGRKGWRRPGWLVSISGNGFWVLGAHSLHYSFNVYFLSCVFLALGAFNFVTSKDNE